MAKTQHLRRRIRSVKNTMQVTRAMKMVSAARLRRSQENLLAARPYAQRIRAVLRSLAARANPEGHPLLRVREERKIEVVVICADRGLCGSFNTNILKRAFQFLAENRDKRVELHAVGKKARDYFRRRQVKTGREWVDISRRMDPSLAGEIGKDVIERYTSGEVDAVYLVYNEFKSAIQQSPVVERLLPVEPARFESGESADDYIYEPDAAALFDELLPHFVFNQVFHAILESAAAEQAARMTAMDSATNNAQELVETLTLHMNRVRQASITTEIIEVVSGAEALG
jgi:F-type H+-transporting ATPase subunit gamma